MEKEIILNKLMNNRVDKYELFMKLSKDKSTTLSDIMEVTSNYLNDLKVNDKDKAKVIYSLAKAFNEEKINIERLSKLIAKTKDPEYLYFFARDIKGADIKIISKAVANCCDAKQIYSFAKNIKDADMSELSRGLSKLNMGVTMYDFAREMPGADIKALSHGIGKLKNSALIYKFAKDIENADIEVLTSWLTKCTKPVDARYIYLFSQNYDIEKYLDQLTKAIILSGNARYIYGFALNVEGVNIESLEKAIIKTKNFEYIDLFRKNVKGASIINKIIENNKIEKQAYSYYDNTKERTASRIIVKK